MATGIVNKINERIKELRAKGKKYNGCTPIAFFSKLLIALFFVCNASYAKKGRLVFLKEELYKRESEGVNPPERLVFSSKRKNDCVRFQTSLLVHVPEGSLLLQYFQESQKISIDSIYNDPQGFIAYNKGVDLLESKSYQEAITYFDQAIHLNPNDSEAYYNKGLALFLLDLYQEAIKAYDQAIKLNPNDSEAYYNKGNALDDLGLYQKAVNCYDQAIKLNPNDSEAYTNKGFSLGQLGLDEEAMKAYDQAIHLNPNDSKAYYNKGVVFTKLGLYQVAITYFDQAININPNFSDAIQGKAFVLEMLEKEE